MPYNFYGGIYNVGIVYYVCDKGRKENLGFGTYYNRHSILYTDTR